MGGVPVHLVGSEYLTEDLPPFEVIKIMEQEGGDDVEQLIAQGSVPVLRNNSHLGERGDQKGVTTSTALQLTEPVGVIVAIHQIDKIV
jgi:hypothetical protein